MSRKSTKPTSKRKHPKPKGFPLVRAHVRRIPPNRRADAAHFGKERRVDDLRPDDFEDFRKALSKSLGVVALRNEINRVRIILKYAFAMTYLAINTGCGNTDIGNLPNSAINFAGGWLDYPRPKTQMRDASSCGPPFAHVAFTGGSRGRGQRSGVATWAWTRCQPRARRRRAADSIAACRRDPAGDGTWDAASPNPAHEAHSRRRPNEWSRFVDASPIRSPPTAPCAACSQLGNPKNPEKRKCARQFTLRHTIAEKCDILRDRREVFA